MTPPWSANTLWPILRHLSPRDRAGRGRMARGAPQSARLPLSGAQMRTRAIQRARRRAAAPGSRERRLDGSGRLRRWGDRRRRL